MHPWHDIEVDDTRLEEAFPAIIEIPAGAKNKYELDKVSGMLRLDRVLYGALHYPANYGFIPRTFCDDGDPLDILVLGQEPVHPMTLLQARPIGVMRMCDKNQIDDKILAVNLHDPAVQEIRDRCDLPDYLMAEIKKFFEEYKTLENKEVAIDTIQAAEAAVDIIREARALYQREIAPHRA